MRAIISRMRMWWMSHRHRVWLAFALLFVAVAYAAVSEWDHRDKLKEANERAARFQRLHYECAVPSSLPRTVFVLQGTPREVQEVLINLGADAEVMRYKAKYGG